MGISEYFVLDKIKDDFDNVWHWKDFPEKLMYECNLIKDYDIFTIPAKDKNKIEAKERVFKSKRCSKYS